VDTLEHLTNALSELKKIEWNVFYLGGMKWGEKNGEPYRKINDCNYLDQPKQLTCTHAIAYNSVFFDTILDELPDDNAAMKEWLVEHVAIDQYLTKKEKMVLISPVVATQKYIQGSEDETMRKDFH
ncbi:MAG: hypothetical protein KAJ95_11145, partial [Gammaproteobacteria bacterium]|nr:hypothetical protein [Gammaproteobacteria bacterium]